MTVENGHCKDEGKQRLNYLEKYLENMHPMMTDFKLVWLYLLCYTSLAIGKGVFGHTVSTLTADLITLLFLKRYHTNF